MSEKSQNVIITQAARRKLVQARAGAIKLPKIVGMAFGNGGVDPSGQVIPPTETQAGLANEIYRKEIEGYSFPEDTTCRYVCTLSEAECAGAEISEIGLYDEEGDVVCVKTFMRKGKDDDVEQTYILDDIF
ncbi:MAG: phage tail protein [Acetatifactor sp.]|nr:phage tail protein [Acetatifactor sp.]